LDSLEVVEEYINTGKKSMYLMDCWMKIREYIRKKEEGESGEVHN
jgi:hypothetical protein